MQIRPAVLADADGIARVQVASWKAAYTGLIPDEIIAARTYERRLSQWQRALERSDRPLIYVATDESGQVVGFASGGAQRDPAYDYDSELYAIYLLPAVQRQGIGHRLVAAVTRQLIEAGYSAMLVWVLRDNSPGRRFYESLGGALAGERVERMDLGELSEVSYGWRDLNGLASVAPPGTA